MSLFPESRGSRACSKVFAQNEAVSGSVKSVFRAWEQRLNSSESVEPKTPQFPFEIRTAPLPFSTDMNPQLKNQESMLKESIKHFLTSYHSGNSDFSSFESIFFRLIQTMLDPPIEITWFYSAVTFHAAKPSTQNNPFTRVVIAKDLLNLLISCSNLSSASKKIALLAPVVFELYNIVCDTRKSDLCVKMEVYKLVENIVSHVMISAGVYNYGNEDVECDDGVVWTTDLGGRDCNFAESLRIFFPLLTDGTWKGMNARCGIHKLVGIVQCEVFFLKLYQCFTSAMCAEDYLNDTRDQMVQMIKGFRNCCFLDMLLNMLLEPSLPAALSLSSEDAVVLRKVLYDAVILVDYSFCSGSWAHSDFIILSKKLSLVWVLAADHAVQFARATKDEAKAVAYLNAYRESQMVTQLIKWVYSQIGMVHPHTRHEITTPRALINWLLALEDQGIRVFDQSMSLLRAKAVACVESEPPQLDLEPSNLNQSRFDLNVTSANEDQEMDGQLNNGVPGDHCLMNMKQDGGKKRKEASSGVEESQNKQIKLDIFGFSLSKRDDASCCEKQVIDISSDDDMDVDKR
ncbi:hypothetical protein ACS0TY_012499 [Phlomoides rotata]